MSERVAFLEGKNQVRDSDFSKFLEFFTSAGIAEGLEVQSNLVTSGYGFIEVTRAGKNFRVLYENTEDIIIDTSGTKKVFIEVTQANIDDGLLNSVDGTGIASVKTAAAYPSGNFVKLASIVGGVITDERPTEILNLGNLKYSISTLGNVTAASFFGDGSNLTGLTAQVSSTSNNYMLGTSGIKSKAYSLVDYHHNISTSSYSIGISGTKLRAYSFYAQDTDIENIDIELKKVGSPDDGVVVEIRTDDGSGKPSDTVVENGTSDELLYSGMTTSKITYSMNFSSVPTLIIGEKYHFIAKRTGSYSEVNYFQIGGTTSGSYIGQGYYFSASWNLSTVIPYFQIHGYKLAVLGGSNFCGISQLSGSEGDIIKFNTSYDANQTSLIEGSFYGYDESNGDIIEGGLFKALSKNELGFGVYDKVESSDNLYRNVLLGESVDLGDPLRKGRGNIITSIDETPTGLTWISTTMINLGNFTTPMGLNQTINNATIKGGGQSGSTDITLFITDASNTVLYTSTTVFLPVDSGENQLLTLDFSGVDLSPNTTYKLQCSAAQSSRVILRYSSSNNYYRQFDMVSFEDDSKYFKSKGIDENKNKVKGLAMSGGILDDTIKMLFIGVATILNTPRKTGLTSSSIGDLTGTSQFYFYGDSPGQTFEIANDSVINSITMRNGGNTRTYEYRLFKDGVQIGNTESSNVQGIKELFFPDPILIVGGDTYEVKIKNIQDSVQKSMYYNPSDVYADGTRTDDGVSIGGDAYFQVDYTEMTDCVIGDLAYLGDDGGISGMSGTSGILIGELVELLKVNVSLVSGGGGVDFVTFTTTGGSATYTTSYTHNLGKTPTRFELDMVHDGGNISSHGYFIDGKYGAVGSQGGAREDCMGILYYSTNDYFKMTVENITDTGFDILYTEVGGCSTTNQYCVIKLT